MNRFELPFLLMEAFSKRFKTRINFRYFDVCRGNGCSGCDNCEQIHFQSNHALVVLHLKDGFVRSWFTPEGETEEVAIEHDISISDPEFFEKFEDLLVEELKSNEILID